MKKIFLFIFLLLNLNLAAAESIIIRSSNEDSELAKVPQLLMATFVDQNFKMVSAGTNIYNLKVLNLRCDSNSRDFLYPDFFNAGLPRVNCFVNADREMNGAGKEILESRYILSLLQLIERKTGLSLSDCAMGGRCTSFVQKINCTSDLNQAEMSKAYSCEITTAD